MAWNITCDSSADLGEETYKKLKVAVQPFTITLGENQFKDGIDVNNQMLFDYVAETKVLPKTSAINALDYEDFFKANNTADEGLIHLSISSKVSSTYNNALEASKKFNNVYVIDSESLSSGMGIQVLYATKLRDKKVPIEEAVKLIEERKKHVSISFVVDKLNYLHKGGRCSALTLLGANVLSLKPSIVLNDGAMGVGKKYVGKIHKVVEKYIEDTLNENSTPDDDLCFITYSSATDEMLNAAHASLEKFGKFKKVQETTAGCTVTTHCGPNTLGIIFYNDGNK